MPKYLVQASYTVEGLKGLVKEGGTARRKAIEQLLQQQGGKLEAFYYAFGETDVFAIMDAPDNATATALSLTINASGAVKLKITPLLTPEEVDQGVKKSVLYRPPGK